MDYTKVSPARRAYALNLEANREKHDRQMKAAASQARKGGMSEREIEVTDKIIDYAVIIVALAVPVGAIWGLGWWLNFWGSSKEKEGQKAL